MKASMSAVALALSLFSAPTFAADSNLGSWTLNESKSKMPAAGVKNTSVSYEQVGDSLKAIVEGVDADGKPTHNEWTGKADGKDYPVVGDPTTDTRALKRIDDHHYQVTNKKDGKVTVTGKVVFAKDLKSRTLTLSGKDAKGKKISGTWVYEKK